MRKLIISLISPLLGYGATMGYLWYEVKGHAEEMVRATASIAQVSYESIHISLLGDEIGFDNIVIKPRITQDEFRIEQVRINAPHIGYFMRVGNSIEKRSLPENISLQISRVHLDMESELFTMLEQSQAAQPQSDDTATLLSSADALGCGDAGAFTLSDYRNMGLGKMVADVTVNVGYDEKVNRTHFTLNTHVDNLYDIDIGVDLNDKPGAMSSASTLNQLPTATVNYRDTGYYRLRNNYCAAMNDSNIEAYVDHHIEQLSATLGAEFPPETISAYRQFMLKGGRFSAKTDPSDEFSLDGLQYYKPADIIAILGLTLRINNAKLDTDQIQWEKPADRSDIKRASQRDGDNTTEPAPPHPPRESIHAKHTSPDPGPVFQTIEVTDAEKYLNRMAEITTAAGKVRRGLMEEVNEDRISLAVKLSAGTLSYPIEISDIDRLRVQY